MHFTAIEFYQNFIIDILIVLAMIKLSEFVGLSCKDHGFMQTLLSLVLNLELSETLEKQVKTKKKQ